MGWERMRGTKAGRQEERKREGGVKPKKKGREGEMGGRDGKEGKQEGRQVRMEGRKEWKAGRNGFSEDGVVPVVVGGWLVRGTNVHV